LFLFARPGRRIAAVSLAFERSLVYKSPQSLISRGDIAKPLNFEKALP
jgi:hypothetical protein